MHALVLIYSIITITIIIIIIIIIFCTVHVIYWYYFYFVGKSIKGCLFSLFLTSVRYIH